MQEQPITWSVRRFSLNTERLLKVVQDGFTSHREAELWLEGFGQDESSLTVLRICPSRDLLEAI